MNHTPKLVASNTLKETPWGKYAKATPLRGDALREIRKLKEKPGRIVTFGSPKLVQSLAEAGLVDLFHIWIHPTPRERQAILSQRKPAQPQAGGKEGVQERSRPA